MIEENYPFILVEGVVRQRAILDVSPEGFCQGVHIFIQAAPIIDLFTPFTLVPFNIMIGEGEW